MMTITRLLGSVTLVMAGGLSLAAPVPKGGLPPAGVFVLDDCDPDFKGKAAYEDNLSAIGPSGKLVFRVSGVNGCESIGSNHIIANDPDRKRVWALEYAGKRICQYDHSGKKLLTVDDVQVSAAAVDPTTGNLWVLISKNGIKTGETIVLDSRGKKVATHPVNGWDIIYDPKGKAFWVAGRNLTKMSAKDGTVLSVQPIATWCASSLDVHPTTGRVWVAIRKDDKVPGDENIILQFDNDGTLLRTVELG
ncbi:MAG TPA: hypothetical protein VFG68_01465, partial [Fimbriiglobus sp.]|nr:hypothetical protein [Fimbriiglobus sp.]